MLRDIFDKPVTFETDRLRLRLLTQQDTRDIYEIFSDRQVMKYYDLSPFESLERAEEQIDLFTNGFEQRTMLRWGIELKDGGKLIGTCGFFAFNEDALKAELGYELNSSYHGKGLMSEALDDENGQSKCLVPSPNDIIVCDKTRSSVTFLNILYPRQDKFSVSGFNAKHCGLGANSFHCKVIGRIGG